jgi:thermostable 8-oxoguanine DNA glycosylase
MTVDDVKYFHQLCNLKAFVQSVQNAEDFKSVSDGDKRVKYFQNSCNADCHSELLKIAELFFCIPSHNTNAERTFSVMNAQWTDEQNRFTT